MLVLFYLSDISYCISIFLVASQSILHLIYYSQALL